MEELPKTVLKGLRQQPGPAAGHPDADLLTAFVEQRLNQVERAQMVEHLAGCAECRRVVSLALPQDIAQPEKAIAPALPRMWARWPAWRWGALAASVLIVGSAVLLRQVGLRPSESQEGSEATAKLRPASPNETAVSSSAPRPRAAVQQLSQPAAQAGMSPQLAKNKAPIPARALRGSAVIPRDQVKAEAVVAAKAQPAPKASVLNAAPAMTANPPVFSTAEQDKASEMVAVTEEPREKERAKSVEVASEHKTAASAGAAAAPVPGTRGLAAMNRMAAAQSEPRNAGAATAPYPALRATDALAPTFRWSISESGEVQRSADGGQTWEVVPVDTGVRFLAIAAMGIDVWAGGTGGLLYHSLDGGQTWSRVAFRSSKDSGLGDVVRIDFKDPRHGVVTLALRGRGFLGSSTTNEVFATADGGRTWQKSRR